MQLWLQNFVRYGWMIGWLGVWAVWLVADWAVPLVFGPDFGPAAAAIKWICLGVPLVALLWAGNVTATVTGRGRLKFGASMVALFVFVLATFWLAPLYGAMGATLALGLSTVANVAVLSLYLHPVFRLNNLLLFVTGAVGTLGLVGVVWLSG